MKYLIFDQNFVQVDLLDISFYLPHINYFLDKQYMKSKEICDVAPEKLQVFFNSKEDLYQLLSVDRKILIGDMLIVGYLLPSKQY